MRTKKTTRSAACIGKRKLTHREADDMVFRRLRAGAPSRAVAAYRCRFCGFWHVGHKPWGFK